MFSKHFATYGDRSFNIQKKRIKYQANQLNFYDKIHVFSHKDISKEFKLKFKNIFNAELGGGYWIWKIYILDLMLKRTNENDIFLYLDAGSTINIKAKKRMNEYFEILHNSDKSFLRFSIDKKEKYWTSKEVFNYFNLNINSNYGESDQLAGGIIFVKNNDVSKNFVKEFYELLDYDEKLITDLYNKNQIDGFVSPRHDQSILSLLGKIYESIIIKDETYFADNLSEQHKYPILTVRDGRYSFWQKFKFYINYFDNLKKPIFFGEKKYYFNKVSLYKRIKFKFKNSFN
tara:strand:+ start:382 stop:1245 length:864 start_codon:yes stop_codon:yes gene_type:complete